MSIPGIRPVGARGGGLSELHQRLGDIQRRMGIAAGASTMTGMDSPGPASLGGSANNDFALALQRAIGGNDGSDVSVAANPTGSPSSSASWSSGIDAVSLDSLARIPVYATKPAGLPPVTVSEAARAAGNGQLPDQLLASIGQADHRLAKPAADGFRRLAALARQDGVTIGVNDSYRDYPSQVAVADRVGLYSQGGWAAAPGTSNHGWGLALDLDLDQRGQEWMTENAWRFGFFEDVPGEPWHWTYRA
ncbi:MAG: D-alanyl-D-alanine carboxypeptidase family protein [Acidimicrobiales bacterium]